MLIKSSKILVILGLLQPIFTVRIEGGNRSIERKIPPQQKENGNSVIDEIEKIKSEENLAKFWNKATPEIISYFDKKFQNHLKYMDFLKNLLKVFKEARKLHEEKHYNLNEIEAKKLHETLKKHHEIVKKIAAKIMKEIRLEKKSRASSVKREFIEIYVKMELSKTIHEANKNKTEFLSKAAEHIAEEEETKQAASQKKNKKKGKKFAAAAVDKTIHGIIKELTFEHVSNGIFHLKVGAKKSALIKEEITKAYDEISASRRNVIIITDMEPDDRIALAAVAARMPERVLFVGTTVLNAQLKKALAKAQLRVTGMADVPVYAGTGGGKDSEFYKNTLKIDGCKAALSYTAEGQGILDENLLKVKAFSHKDKTDAVYYKGDELQNQIKIALENAKEQGIDFLVLSPPTDLVAVLEEHPELMQKILKIHIMGGWREGEETLWTTYNFNMDINASVKLIKWAIDGKLSCILYSTHVIAPLFGGGSIKSQNAPELIETILSSKAPAMEQFRKAASSWDAHLISVYEKLKGVIGPNAGKQFTPADPLVVIGYLEPKMIVKTEKIVATICTEDQTKIGYRVEIGDLQGKSNLELVTSINKDLFLRELQSAIRQLEPKESVRNNHSIPTNL